MKILNRSKPGYTSITYSKISNIPYNNFFTTQCNDSSILITIISCDNLNLMLANEYVSDVTTPTQGIMHNQNFLQADQPIILQYSNQIKLFRYNQTSWKYCFICRWISWWELSKFRYCWKFWDTFNPLSLKKSDIVVNIVYARPLAFYDSLYLHQVNYRNITPQNSSHP